MSSKGDKYLLDYQDSVDQAVRLNPHTACGSFQRSTRHLDYLMLNGLRPNHRLLDLGCGVIRSGRHFIEYLNKDRYFGVDMSVEAIYYAADIIQGQQTLREKHPRVVASNGKFTFDWFNGPKYDWIWMGSVVNHIMPEHFEDLLGNVGKAMHPKTKLMFTFKDTGKWKLPGFNEFMNHRHYFATVGSRNGLVGLECDDFALPGGSTTVFLVEKK